MDTQSIYQDVIKFATAKHVASALSKNPDLPKEDQMINSLMRIKKLRTEVWAVKLADRITNLQEPPLYWYYNKKMQYLEEARIILNELGAGNDFLAERLKKKIEEYANIVNPEFDR